MRYNTNAAPLMEDKHLLAALAQDGLFAHRTVSNREVQCTCCTALHAHLPHMPRDWHKVLSRMPEQRQSRCRAPHYPPQGTSSRGSARQSAAPACRCWTPPGSASRWRGRLRTQITTMTSVLCDSPFTWLLESQET